MFSNFKQALNMLLPKNSLKSVIFVVVLLLGLLAGIVAVQTVQELRRKASTGPATLTILPGYLEVDNTSLTGSANVIEMPIYYDSGGQDTTAVEIRVTNSTSGVGAIEDIIPENLLPTVLKKSVTGTGAELILGISCNDQGCARFSGSGKIATLKLRAVSVGALSVDLAGSQTAVVGSTTNVLAEIHSATGTVVEQMVCWNRVVRDGNGTLNWPDAGKGTPGSTDTSAQVVTPLTPDEINSYETWSANLPQNTNYYLYDCGMPLPIPQTSTSSPSSAASATATATSSPTASATATASTAASASPSGNITSQTMRFLVRFGGVAADQAEGAKIKVRFVKGTYDTTTPAFAVTHIADGVYEGSINLSGSPIPVGTGYTFYVKGEKHLSTKFCLQSGTQTRCTGLGNIGIAGGANVYDFSNLALAPGDLPQQDGVASANDFLKIKNLLTKPCGELTEQDKLTADLDYSGCVNIRDAFLMRQTLETRYDEN